MQGSIRSKERLERQGLADAQLLFPVVDLSRCLGCATCVAVCPENGVLELVHGQAVVVNGARCVGVAACERECPVGAIRVTIANLATRKDVPVLMESSLEAAGQPGLFLAGEVTAHALIKTAVEHGTAVAGSVAQRVAAGPLVRQPVGVGVDAGRSELQELDLLIVGAGPAGLACSLEAKRLGLRFVTLDQAQTVGGTVAKYPRRKLVLLEPVDLPLHGRLRQRSYTKEELMQLWGDLAAEHQLPIRTGETVVDIERDDEGRFVVRTKTGRHLTNHLCLALGRRGTPRRLGVAGEDLPKVAHSLLDAHSYTGRRILVVGGGDSAVETALALAEQPGNQVTLSYRKDGFFRIRTQNQERLDKALAQGRLEVLLRSEVVSIGRESVELSVRNGTDRSARFLGNDEVFVMAGGTPPVALLEKAGVGLDPSLRPASAPAAEQGTGLLRALGIAFLLALAALGWALVNLDYYGLAATERPIHAKHQTLRPGQGAGLWLGILATAMVVINLLYLLRRSPRVPFHLGSLQLWMTSHIATGILAVLCATLHGAMAPGNTVGGHAFWALSLLLLTGAIGRYFYAWVPRAANGRELELAEVKAQLQTMSADVHAEVTSLIEARQWKGTLFGRIGALLGLRRDLRRSLDAIAKTAREQGVAPKELRKRLLLARRAHRTALMTAHYEDLRALLGTWRYLHRWVALLMVLLVVSHIYSALFYGASYGGAG